MAAATYGYAALPIQTVLSFGIGAARWLLWSLLMWKTVFRRTTAIFGVAVSVIGITGSLATIIPSTTFLGLLQVLSAPARAIWFLVVGFQLRRHIGQLADLA